MSFELPGVMNEEKGEDKGGGLYSPKSLKKWEVGSLPQSIYIRLLLVW